MVHALLEARRVLEPNGLLIDLRPATVHRRVRVVTAGRTREVGATRETFDDERAANRAVVRVVRAGRLVKASYVRFGCDRKMDTLAEFRFWLQEAVRLLHLPSHAWLAARVERAMGEGRGRKRIVVSAPLEMTVFIRP